MKQLTRRREKAGLLMEDLALKSGIHLATVREIEGGKDRRVQARVRRALSTALGLNPSDLFDDEGRAK